AESARAVAPSSRRHLRAAAHPTAVRTLFLSADWKPDRGGIAELHASLLAPFPAGAVEVSTVRAPAGWRDVFPHPVRRLPMGFRESSRLPGLVRWTLAARRRVRDGGFDVALAGTLRPAGGVAAALRRLEALPFALLVHGKDVLKERAKVERSPLYRALAGHLLRAAGAVVANSRFTADEARELGRAAGAPELAERVHVVHPGADPLRFHPGDDGVRELRARLGLEARRVALTVGRLEARKGMDAALEAVASLAGEFPDLVYVVAGAGPRNEDLRRRASSADLAGRVLFLGDVADDELPALYRAAELFLLPSRREAGDEVEGFGLVLLEASATGLPVVGGRSGGVADAVLEGETGILVDPASSADLARAMRALLADPGLAARLGGGGRDAVLRRFNWDRAAGEVQGILAELAGEGNRRRPWRRR
ncbi:MAG: glycosyltransferase family 4 protein, partial [Gemmatimonadota bacterium]